MKEFEFLEKKIEETKQEIRSRKKWITALKNEYCKARTFKYNQQGQIIRMIKIGNIMVEHYTKILEEQKLMLKELKGVK